MFSKPVQKTLKTDHTSHVSRCSVCQRRRAVNQEPATSSFQHQPSASYHPEDLDNDLDYDLTNQNYYQHQRNPGNWQYHTPDRTLQPVYNHKDHLIIENRENKRLLDQTKKQAGRHKHSSKEKI